MKNAIKIMTLFSTCIVVASDDEILAHATEIVKTIDQTVRLYFEKNDQTVVDDFSKKSLAEYEAEKHYKQCLFLEFARRSSVENINIKVSNQTNDFIVNADEFYAKKCPSVVYQNIPNGSLFDLITNKSNQTQFSTPLIVASSDDNSTKSEDHAATMVLMKTRRALPIVEVGMMVDEVDITEGCKNLQTCLFIEFAKRFSPKHTLVKISNKNDKPLVDMNEFYKESCPSDLYEKVPNHILFDSVLKN